jgi:hypothetical protein
MLPPSTAPPHCSSAQPAINRVLHRWHQIVSVSGTHRKPSVALPSGLIRSGDRHHVGAAARTRSPGSTVPACQNDESPPWLAWRAFDVTRRARDTTTVKTANKPRILLRQNDYGVASFASLAGCTSVALGAVIASRTCGTRGTRGTRGAGSARRASNGCASCASSALGTVKAGSASCASSAGSASNGRTSRASRAGCTGSTSRSWNSHWDFNRNDDRCRCGSRCDCYRCFTITGGHCYRTDQCQQKNRIFHGKAL